MSWTKMLISYDQMTREINAIILLILFAINCSFGQNSVQGDKSRTLVFGSSDNHLPFTFIDADGNPNGFYVDLLREIGKEIGYEFQIVLMDWDEVYYQFLNDSLDVSTLYFDESRAGYAEFSETVSIVDQMIIVRKSSPSIVSLEDLSGRQVVVQKKSFLEENLERDYPEIVVRGVSSQPEALKLLAEGKYDAAIVDEFLAQQLALDESYKNLVLTGPPVLPQLQTFAVKKGNSELIEKINDGLEQLREKGIYLDLFSKWFSVYQPKKSPWSVFLERFLKDIVLGFMLILFIVAISIYSLRRAV
ncbi:transporter substrate-binding domain-containing protein, partial [Xanthovirga aplysinae]|uniref:transporter substrate-binding domain-containing protein n=1 Tax=Xanthovirga aplysinae TaxID=2529853 RepID=UPI001CA39AAF